jgi:hypothetical protein
MGTDDPTLSSRASAFFIAAEGSQSLTLRSASQCTTTEADFFRCNTRAFGSLPYRLGLGKLHLRSADCLQQPLRTCYDEP